MLGLLENWLSGLLEDKKLVTRQLRHHRAGSFERIDHIAGFIGSGYSRLSDDILAGAAELCIPQ